MANRWGTMKTVTDFLFLGSLQTSDHSHEIKRRLLFGRKAMTNLDSILKTRHITLPTEVHIIKGFSSSHVWMGELVHKEGWVLKNRCFWIAVLEKTVESPLDSKEINPVSPKRNQPWIFIRRTNADAEAPILWPPNMKNWLTGKKPWCWERLKAGGKGVDREWDGWMTLLTWWTWVWISPRSWWWTGKPDVLQAMGLQCQAQLSDWTDWLTLQLKKP